MNRTILSWYAHYRNEGNTGSYALHAARTKVRFDELEEQGLVRLHAEPECDVYDDSYIDDPNRHASERSRERERKELYALLDREGSWTWIGQYRARDTDAWEYADNIGMIIGDDLCGYDIELMASAIEEYEKSIAFEASCLAERVTYAGV